MDIASIRALVTGGSSGIGKEIARCLCDRGAKVVICGRDEEKLRSSALEIGAIPIRADIAIESNAVSVVREAARILGDYNVLVNNAGVGLVAPLIETTLEEMQRVLATNVFGAMIVARESARLFVERKKGTIVNVGSRAGVRGFPGATAYAASKFALSGMTECWRAELRNSNVRVMLINPSEVQTHFLHRRPFSERKLRPAEIAQAVLSMLAMDDHAFVTDVSVWPTNPD